MRSSGTYFHCKNHDGLSKTRASQLPEAGRETRLSHWESALKAIKLLQWSWGQASDISLSRRIGTTNSGARKTHLTTRDFHSPNSPRRVSASQEPTRVFELFSFAGGYICLSGRQLRGCMCRGCILPPLPPGARIRPREDHGSTSDGTCKICIAAEHQPRVSPALPGEGGVWKKFPMGRGWCVPLCGRCPSQLKVLWCVTPRYPYSRLRTSTLCI